MSVDAGETYQGLDGEEDRIAIIPNGAQTMYFYKGRDPKFDGSGIPRGDNPPPATLAELLDDYRAALIRDYGEDLGAEAAAALTRFETHLGATGISTSLQN